LEKPEIYNLGRDKLMNYLALVSFIPSPISEITGKSFIAISTIKAVTVKMSDTIGSTSVSFA
jgi:hypothetical protein